LANSLTRTPFEIDTPFPSWKSSVASILGTLMTLRVKKLRWVGISAGGQQLIVNDPQGGNQLVMLTSSAANLDVEIDFSASPRIWADFGVPAVPSGKLFIYADVG
jgi:hypothetical protein